MCVQLTPPLLALSMARWTRAIVTRGRSPIPLRTVIQGSAGVPKYSTAGTPEGAPLCRYLQFANGRGR
jgi:hypothetical protein